ncbi:MAG: hypothetical protein KGY51_12000 [Psychroflexus sp.]|nr:hypothetical protein [Psychroflexus sp.]
MYYYQKYLDRNEPENGLERNAYIVVDRFNYDVVGEYMTLSEARETAYNNNLDLLTDLLEDNHGLKPEHSRDGEISQNGCYFYEHYFINDFDAKIIENILSNPKQFCKKLKAELIKNYLPIKSVRAYIFNDGRDSFLEFRLKHSNKISFDEGMKNRYEKEEKPKPAI